MKVVVLGAGLMGYAVIYDLCQNKDITSILVIDSQIDQLNLIKNRISDKRIIIQNANVEDIPTIERIINKSNIIINTTSYKYNVILTKIAIKNQVNFIDLGGNNDIVKEQFSLSDDAKKNGITVIPDCGLAPGLVSVIASDVLSYFDIAEDINIRVGGLPLKPEPPLNYKIVFSPEGLINEYFEPTIILKNNEKVIVDSLTGIEEIDFEQPFGKMEAFYTSGGISTSPETFFGKVKNINYKTIRYPLHSVCIQSIFSLGFGSKTPMKYGNVEFIPRNILIKMLSEYLGYTNEDVILLRVTANGTVKSQKHQIVYESIERCDKELHLTAMMKMTAFPASIVAQMILSNDIKMKGVIPQELCVPSKKMFSELEKRNIKIKINFS